MKRVYTSADPLIVGHLENVLKRQGIACFVRNRYLAGGVGELPPTEVWPQLWVEEDRDEAAARRLIGEVMGEVGEPGPPWRCPRCGESIEGQFAECWNCGAHPDD
ncbi:MAG: DUF2007 domain-containing protein [Ectothiorhodospiraceae bacterium]|jgi:hypothetical protein